MRGWRWFFGNEIPISDTGVTKSRQRRLRQPRQRESSLLTTYWSEPLNHRDNFSKPALRHGSLNSLFQVALYLPSCRRDKESAEEAAAAATQHAREGGWSVTTGGGGHRAGGGVDSRSGSLSGVVGGEVVVDIVEGGYAGGEGGEHSSGQSHGRARRPLLSPDHSDAPQRSPSPDPRHPLRSRPLLCPRWAPASVRTCCARLPRFAVPAFACLLPAGKGHGGRDRRGGRAGGGVVVGLLIVYAAALHLVIAALLFALVGRKE